MFNQSRKSAEEMLSNDGHLNVIAYGTSIKGDIHSECDIRIDGKLSGTLSSKAKVIIGPQAELEGELFCVNAVIFGQVKGLIKAEEKLNLRESSIVEGDLMASKIEMEPTAVFNGKCNMKTLAVEEFKPELRQLKLKNVTLKKETA